MRAIYVPLPESALDRLRQVARRERRRPKDTAALILEGALAEMAAEDAGPAPTPYPTTRAAYTVRAEGGHEQP